MKLSNNNFTIYEVEEIREKFIEQLSKDKILIDLSSITKIDMSAIQLLISLQITCKELGKEFEIKNIKDEILNVFKITGTSLVLGVENE